MNPDYSIEELAEALEVSKSGFHAHRHKQERPRRQRDAELRPLIHRSFEQSRKTYGSPRLLIELREQGHRCGKNRISRLMREEGLRPKQKRRFRPRTTDSRHDHRIAENWLAKVPAPDRPGMIRAERLHLSRDAGGLVVSGLYHRCLLAALRGPSLPPGHERRAHLEHL